MTNQLANENQYDIIIYSWGSLNKINWGIWNKSIKIRIVPFFKYFQKLWAIMFYNFWIRRDSPDCILINFLYHGELFLPKKLNYVYVLHSPADYVPNRYIYIKKNLNKFKNINFVAVSKFVKDQASNYLPRKKIIVIYNGVDTKIFNKTTRTRTRKVQIISLSALEKRKRIQNVISALNKLRDPNIYYSVYGEGPYYSKLKKLIKRNKMESRIKLKGTTNYPQKYLSESDVFILLSRGEAFPIAPLEAMSCGLPVIVSNEKPYNEIISKEFGLLVNPHSEDEIIKSIIKIKSKPLRIKLGNKSRSLIEKNFSIIKMKNKYKKLINSLINAKADISEL